jgi:hypothetical protein
MSLRALVYDALVILSYEMRVCMIVVLLTLPALLVGGLIHRFERSIVLCFLIAEVALIGHCLYDHRSGPSRLLMTSLHNPLLIWNAVGYLPAIASILAGYWGMAFLKNILEEKRRFEQVAGYARRSFAPKTTRNSVLKIRFARRSMERRGRVVAAPGPLINRL